MTRGFQSLGVAVFGDLENCACQFNIYLNSAVKHESLFHVVRRYNASACHNCSGSLLRSEGTASQCCFGNDGGSLGVRIQYYLQEKADRRRPFCRRYGTSSCTEPLCEGYRVADYRRRYLCYRGSQVPFRRYRLQLCQPRNYRESYDAYGVWSGCRRIF